MKIPCALGSAEVSELTRGSRCSLQLLVSWTSGRAYFGPTVQPVSVADEARSAKTRAWRRERAW